MTICLTLRSEPLWPIEARNAAIANSYFTCAINRVGTVCSWHAFLSPCVEHGCAGVLPQRLHLGRWQAGPPRLWPLLWIQLCGCTQWRPYPGALFLLIWWKVALIVLSGSVAHQNRAAHCGDRPEHVSPGEGQVVLPDDPASRALCRVPHQGRLAQLPTADRIPRKRAPLVRIARGFGVFVLGALATTAARTHGLGRMDPQAPCATCSP